MFEYHAWLGLADNAYENSPTYAQAIDTLRTHIPLASSTGSFAVVGLNGSYVLSMNGVAQHRERPEVEKFQELLTLVSRILPASYGLIYERDHDVQEEPGPNAFRVKIMRRGVLAEVEDPFFSPADPLIED